MLLAAGAAAALVLAGCGSDDDESDDTDADVHRDAGGHDRSNDAERRRHHGAETTGDTTCNSGDADAQTVCDNLIELDQTVPTGQATPGRGQRNARRGDRRRRRGDRGACSPTSRTALQPVLDDPEAEPSDEFFGQYTDDARPGSVRTATSTTLDVHAEEYHFVGLPEELDAGYYIVNFTNDGNEAHELVAAPDQRRRHAVGRGTARPSRGGGRHR